MEYAEISGLLDESEANCRQIFKRSRDKLHSSEARFRTNEADCELALERFLAASRDGNLDDLMDLVAPGIVLMRDAGDIGLPCPAPLQGLKAAMEHVRAYFGRHEPLSWTCNRIGENYELATLRSRSRRPVCAFISSVGDDRKLARIEQIICPTRLSILLKLVGLDE